MPARNKISAGLLLYRLRQTTLEVFLAHPGGPFWARKDEGAWTIPKGECRPGELLLAAAQREFTEETGFPAAPPFLELGSIRQAGGKTVHAWAFAGDCNPADLRSNLCLVEWPPRSGRQLQIPEIDRGDWFSIAEANLRILKSQQPFLATLCLITNRS